jgi:hypothetical protein
MHKNYSSNLLRVFYPVLVLTLLALAALTPTWSSPASAQPLRQNEERISLSVTKVFGYSTGFGKVPGAMQGTFNITARGPADLESVAFYLDGQLMGEVRGDPFRLQFTTDVYPPGVHTFTAVGRTRDGREIGSEAVGSTFVTPGQGSQQAMRLVFPLLGLAAVAVGLSAFLTSLAGRKLKTLPAGAPRNYGAMGGTICGACRRPFPFAFFSPNLMFGKLQRCPFCGKWQLSRRASGEQLRQAEQAELEAEQQGSGAGASSLSEDERLRREIEGTRYQ